MKGSIIFILTALIPQLLFAQGDTSNPDTPAPTPETSTPAPGTDAPAPGSDAPAPGADTPAPAPGESGSEANTGANPPQQNQQNPQTPQKRPQGPNFFLIMILMFVLMYFLILRPQRIRQKKMQEQMEAMKKGDRAITAGGIHGIVENVKDKTVTLRVADNVRIEFEKTSIAHVLKKGAPASSSADDSKEKSES